MCGRFVVAGASSDLVALFDVDLESESIPAPSWNIAPTDPIPIVIDTIPRGEPESEPVRRMEAARWGLVPSWAKDVSVGVKAFNARIETAAEKPTFKTAVTKRRALVPATGYYEWRTDGDTKTPHFIHMPDGELLVFAALYEWWRNPAAADDAADKWVLSASILTRPSTGSLATIHDRMPVFLSPEIMDDWLDPHTEGSEELLEAVSLAGAAVADFAEFHEVDRAVGSVRNNSPELIAPVASAG